MSILSSIRIVPGLRVINDGKKYRVLELLYGTEVLVVSDEGLHKKFDASDLLPDMAEASSDLPDLSLIHDTQWARAIEIYEWIRPLVEKGKGNRTRAEVVEVADSLDRHTATVYRWLNDFESTGLISSLMRRKRNDIGNKRLSPEVEKVINETIEEFYLTVQRRDPARIAFEVRKRCKQNNLSPPDASTVKKRILEIPEEKRVRKRRL